MTFFDPANFSHMIEALCLEPIYELGACGCWLLRDKAPSQNGRMEKVCPLEQPHGWIIHTAA